MASDQCWSRGNTVSVQPAPLTWRPTNHINNAKRLRLILTTTGSASGTTLPTIALRLRLPATKLQTPDASSITARAMFNRQMSTMPTAQQQTSVPSTSRSQAPVFRRAASIQQRAFQRQFSTPTSVTSSNVSHDSDAGYDIWSLQAQPVLQVLQVMDESGLCWVCDIPLPGNPDGTIWVSDSVDANFRGSGFLDVSFNDFTTSTTMTVSTTDPSSLFLFCTLGQSSPLHINNYGIFFHCLWQLYSHDIMTTAATRYEFLWAHGLLLNLFHNTQLPAISLFAQETERVYFEHVEREPLSANAKDQTLLLGAALLGQVNLFLYAGSADQKAGEPFTFTDSMWNHFTPADLLSPAAVNEWTRNANTEASWELGTVHLHRFVRATISGMFEQDVQLEYPSYRYIRLLPLLVQLGIISDSVKIAAAVSAAGALANKTSVQKELEENIFNEIIDWHACGEAKAQLAFRAQLLTLPSVTTNELATTKYAANKKSSSISAPVAGTTALLFTGEHNPVMDFLSNAVHRLANAFENTRFSADAIYSRLRFAGANEQQAQAILEQADALVQSLVQSVPQLLDAESSVRMSCAAAIRCAREILQLPEAARLGLGPLLEPAKHQCGSVLTVFASCSRGYVDGPWSTARLHCPSHVVWLDCDRVLIVEGKNNSLRLLNTTEQTLQSIIGQSGAGLKEGPCETAKLSAPTSACVLQDGRVLIADAGNHRIRGVSPDLKTIRAFAGKSKGFLNGPISAAKFNNPTYLLELPERGLLLVADTNNHCIRAINEKTGEVFTVAGQPGAPGEVDGSQADARLNLPGCMTMDPRDGTVYFVAGGSRRVYRLRTDFSVETLVGVNGWCNVESALTVKSFFPDAVLFDPATKTLLITDKGHFIYSVSIPEPNLPTSQLQIIVMVGDGNAITSDGNGPQAHVNSPCSLTKCETDGSILFCENNGHNVRRLSTAATLRESLSSQSSSVQQLEKCLSKIKESSQTIAQSLSGHVGSMRTAFALLDTARNLIRFGAYAYALDKSLSSIIKLPFSLQIAVAATPRVHALQSIVPFLVAAPALSREILKDSLLLVLRQYQWNRNDCALDVHALLELSRVLADSHSSVDDDEVLVTVFRNETFTFPITSVELDFLNAYLQRLSWTHARTECAKIRSPIVQWLKHLVAGPAVELLLYDFVAGTARVLQWWSQLVHSVTASRPASSQYDPRTFKWLIRASLDDVCLNPQFRMYDTYAAFPLVMAKTQSSLHAWVLREYIDVVTESSKFPFKDGSRECIALLFPEPETHLHRNELKYSATGEVLPPLVWLPQSLQTDPVYHACVRIIFCTIIDRIHAARNAKIRVTLETYLREASSMWCYLIQWMRSTTFSPKLTSLDSSNPVNQAWSGKELLGFEQRLVTLDNEFMLQLEKVYKQLYNSTLMIGLAYACREFFTEVVSAWTALGHADARSALEILFEQLDEARGSSTKPGLFDRVKDVISEFYGTTSPIMQSVAYVHTNIRSLSIGDVRSFLNFPGEYVLDENSVIGVRVEKLPPTLISHLTWLEHLSGSPLFKYFWNQFCEFPDVEHLLAARIAWQSFFQSIDALSTTYQALGNLCDCFTDDQDLKLLSMTGRSDLLTPVDLDWVAARFKLLRHWRHASSVLTHHQRIAEAMDCCGVFIDSKGHEELRRLQQALTQFVQANQTRWNALTLNDYSATCTTAELIDACLYETELPLLRLIVESSEFLEWARTMANDADFTSSIEIALGKTEMECPPELWEEEHGRTGHTNEQILSQLTLVRSYFHSFLYCNVDRFESLNAMLNILRTLESPTPALMESLATCNELRIPLMELFDDRGADAAPDRLLQLLQPKRCAMWHCVFVDGASSDELLQIRYTIPRKNGGISQVLAFNDLCDFQSSVVLAGTSMRSTEVQAAIDEFVLQFGWMRRLSSCLTQLRDSGHYNFQQFNISFSLREDGNLIRLLATRFKNLHDMWCNDLERLRRTHYFLNFFTMSQLWTLMDAMHEASPSATTFRLCDNILTAALVPKTTASALFAELHGAWQRPLESFLQSVTLSVVTVESDLVVGSAAEVTTADFVHSQLLNIEKSGRDTISSLDVLGTVTAKVLQPVPLQRRVLVFDNKDNGYSGSDVSVAGVHVVCVPDCPRVFDHVTSFYARSATLPERWQVLLCNRNTTWEDLFMLVLRWERAHLFGHGDRMFCFASIEHLSFDLQHKLASAIREVASTANSSLLIVCGSSREQHLVTQFSHRRAQVAPLQPDMLQIVGSRLAQDRFVTFTSKLPGAGKTFAVRRTAAERGAQCVTVSVNRNLGVDEFIAAIEHALRLHDIADVVGTRILLHLDLGDPVATEFSALLFELVMFGTLASTAKGRYFFCDPEQTMVAIELACGPLKSRLGFCDSLPQICVEASRERFCAAPYELLALGMGASFQSPRHDGTTLLNSGDARQTADAYSRLHYVCNALFLLTANKGLFPYDFNGILNPAAPETILPSEECFDLLLQYSDLRNRLSFSCLWNFIDVMYYQLREMHHSDSPINVACMPDKHAPSSYDTESKEKIKGELVLFLVHTAVEFATAQVIEQQDNKIVSCWVEGMSRPEWNGFWNRCEFDNDGQPCMKLGNFFLYFRNLWNKWVIDDIVEPRGAVFSESTNANINSQWTTSPSWEKCPSMRVRTSHDPKGYRGEAVTVSGAPVTHSINGVYVRQPAFDDIDGHAHYMMASPRRHLFWSKRERSWQICPVCSDDEGAFGISETSALEGMWLQMPSDILEKQFKFTLLDRDSEADRFARYRSAIQGATAPVRVMEVDAEAERLGYGQLLKLAQWNDSNHECMLFNNVQHVVSFLSLDPRQLRAHMHPGLLRHLQQNNIDVGEGMDDLNARFHEILSGLTGVRRTKQAATALLDGKYCLTGDALLKMLAIFMRLCCGIPVILMGECGCGKTMLIRYLCAWLDVQLMVLDVNGGTSEQDIIQIFTKAERTLGKMPMGSSIFVFLDEVNACAHMGILCEVICRRTLQGRRIAENIQILAALNPYRRRKDHGNEGPGLVFHLHGDRTPDPMRALVYRVHPIPATMQDYIFDFGSLTSSQERLYVTTMISSTVTSATEGVVAFISDLIMHCQMFVRATEGDPSACSLRDVRRSLNLLTFFLEHIVPKRENPKLSPLAASTMLALAFVYYYRLPNETHRKELLDSLRWNCDWELRGIRGQGFQQLGKVGAIEQMLQAVQRNFSKNIIVDEGIAMNQALQENVFVVIICILNKIPVFMVGKPGTSKTLTMQVVTSNLQGLQSPNPFWRKFPAVYVFQYQCSPMSSAHSIQHQFDMAVSYHRHSQNVATVLLLDEVGLAEHSPDLPLKVLHTMLVDPPIAVVGLSNWILDPAKMNRAICLQRPEPSEKDVELTGRRIITNSDIPDETSFVDQPQFNLWLSPLALAYHRIYCQQKDRDFLGMRDYYSLLKLLRRSVDANGGQLTSTMLAYALSRNFGGKAALSETVLETFHALCFPKEEAPAPPLLRDLLRDNLEDTQARHLMILTRHGAALPLLFGAGLLKERDTTVLIGSEFQDDMTELNLVQEINMVKLAMAAGRTVVLVNHDNIYEALYDVLNQRYVYKFDATANKRRKLLRLAIGARSQLCPVAEGFKVVVVVEQEHAYEHLDLPLLNRFEKQLFRPVDILGKYQSKLVSLLTTWTQELVRETELPSIQDVFAGYHDGTIASLVLRATSFDDTVISEGNINVFVESLKLLLARTAFPGAILSSSSLRQLDGLDYFQHHADFDASVEFISRTAVSFSGDSVMMLTRSPSAHLAVVMKAHKTIRANTFASHVHYRTVQLAELSSEQQLRDIFSQSLRSVVAAPAALIVQCDPYICKQALIEHARFVCVRERIIFDEDCKQPLHPRHIIFVVHMPPGIKNRQRNFAIDFHAPWTYLLVDDLRPEGLEDVAEAATDFAAHEKARLTTEIMTSQSLFELVSEKRVSLSYVMQSKFQSALAACVVPVLDAEPTSVTDYRLQPGTHLFPQRILLLRELFSDSDFVCIIERSILEILENNKFVDRSGMHVHVRLASTDMACGSLRQSLYFAMHNLLVHCLSQVLRSFDVNFNLSLLTEHPHALSSSHLKPLWHALSNLHVVLNAKTFALRSLVASAGSSYDNLGTSAEVLNSGVHGPLVAKFPFSHAVVSILNTKDTREAVETALRKLPANTGDRELAKLEILQNTCRQVFTPSVVDLWECYIADHPDAYLHDYVRLACRRVPGIGVATLHTVYAALSKITFPLASSPAAVHAAMWLHDARLFRIFSILGSGSLSRSVHHRILDTVDSLAKKAESQQLSPVATRLEELDLLLVHEISAQLLTDASLLHTGSEFDLKMWLAWAEVVSCVAEHIEALLLDHLHSSSPRLSILLQKWRGLVALKLFVQEVLLPSPQVHTQPLTEIVSNISNHQLRSHAGMRQLLDLVRKCCSPDTESLCANLLRRLLQEIVFGFDTGFSVLPNETPLDDTLVADVLDIVGFEREEVLGLNVQLLDMPLRRIALHCLLSSQMDRHKFARRMSTSIQTVQLYLHYLEDHFEEEGNTFAITDAECSLLKVTTLAELNEDNLLETVKAFAKVRVVLRRIGRAMCEDKHELSAYELSRLPPTLLIGNSNAREYVMKVVRSQAGVDGILQIYSKPEEIRAWATVGANLLKVATLSSSNRLMDPFSMIAGRESYESMCQVVRTCLTSNGSTKAIEEAMKRSALQSKVLFLAAVFTQGVQVRDAIHDQSWAFLQQWIKESIVADFQIEIRALAYKWVSSCCPLVASEHHQSLIGVAAQIQLTTHLVAVASQLPVTSWLNILLFNPRQLKGKFVPSMPENEFAMVYAASGYVGWYKCPNGHPYTVGECTRPMQESICNHPGCGARIGGRNHESARNNTRMSEADLMRQTALPGYLADAVVAEAVVSAKSDAAARYTGGRGHVMPLTMCVLRFIIHSLLRVAVSLPDGVEASQRADVVNVVLGKHSERSSTHCATFLANRAAEDWLRLLALTNLYEADLCLALHLVFNAITAQHHTMPPPTRPSEREDLEIDFQRKCVGPIFSNWRQTLTAARNELQASNRSALVREVLTEKVWHNVYESKFARYSSDLERALWRLREPVSLEHVRTSFQLRSENSKEFPLLHMFFKEEGQLSIVKHIAVVLEWHEVLFRVLETSHLRRENAANITNAHIIEQLPVDQQEAALNVLDRYCEGFNCAFPLIRKLYECQDNPFLGTSGRVDLSGTGNQDLGMSRDTPISFSLPTMVQGETDAQGLCTIQLLNLMQTVHNKIVGLVRGAASSAEAELEEPHLRKPTQGPTAAVAKAGDGHDDEEEAMVISYLTPRESLAQQLIYYDSKRDFLPLARCFSVQPLSFGDGGYLHYDFQLIEEALVNGIFANKRPITVQVRHFQYAGELHATGRLGRLQLKIAQEDLTETILETLMNEVDTDHRLTKVAGVLEDCINFLVNIGGGHAGSAGTQDIDRNTTFKRFCLDTLLMNSEMWESEIGSPSLDRLVKLCHLRSLVLAFEQRGSGSILDRVALRYRDELEPELELLLRDHQHELDRQLLLPTLRDFITDQLSSTQWPAEASLKEYLGYAAVVDLDACVWYAKYFPNNLQLRHAFHVYRILSSM